MSSKMVSMIESEAMDRYGRNTRYRLQSDRGGDHITETKFWDTLMHDVYGPRKGGAIIFLDAENARKGVAKTSGATALARLLSRAFGYQLATDDLTLSGAEYLKRYQSHPGQHQPSVLVLDEFVGAGAGDKRRAMSHQNVDFGRAWQLLRTRRVVTVATLPDWNEVDKRLKKLADYRVWCREKPIGTFQPYKVTVPFNADGAATVRTKGLNKIGSGARRIRFPNMDAQADPYYQQLTEKKDELINSQSWDADDLQDDDEDSVQDPDEVKREQAIKYALRLYEPWDDENGVAQQDAADVIDYGRTWVANRVREWRDGEHRDLVPDPTAETEEAVA